MAAIDELFSNLRREKRKALMPFVTAGDPDLEFTAAVLNEACRPRLSFVRSRHSVQRPDCRWAGDSGVVHAGARAQDQARRHSENARRRRAES